MGDPSGGIPELSGDIKGPSLALTPNHALLLPPVP
jgi:hypothetical protein